MESKQPFNRGSDRARPRMDMRDAQRLLDAAPPHAIEAEMSLLGSILIDPKATRFLRPHEQEPMTRPVI